MARHGSVDDYLAHATHWSEELTRLRDIVKRTPLEETVKWNSPCYTSQGRNVVGIGGFKSYFGLWFYDGALLKDARGLLINAQPGKTRVQRQWRMSSARDIKPTIIRSYISEAIELVKAGQGIKPRRGRALTLPLELRDALRADDAARLAFDKLRPGQRREYAVHIGDAKRAATRLRRTAAALPRIVAGQGLHDRYRPRRA